MRESLRHKNLISLGSPFKIKNSKIDGEMHYYPLPDAAARQLIDADGLWHEWARVEHRYGDYAGGMYWKREGAYEYLVKTGRKGRQTRIGPRNDYTEQIYQDFFRHKQELLPRLRSLQAQLQEARRLNKAVKVGRAPAIVIDLLEAFRRAGLAPYFTVVGTHALYAYEAAAGVRLVSGTLATQDVDLLWDARKRVRFMADVQHLQRSVLSVLQEADASFQRKALALETAVNAKGFMVDFLRRVPVDGDPHPLRLSPQEDDLFAVQAQRAQVLTESPVFEHLVVGATGAMALMRTIDPGVFVNFKRWLSRQPGREPIKRQRDATQADAVQHMISGGLLEARVPVLPN
ncbi:MAG: GSU2403 family nucleotidyltransferase fold protein [Rhodoferax sp.]